MKIGDIVNVKGHVFHKMTVVRTDKQQVEAVYFDHSHQGFSHVSYHEDVFEPWIEPDKET